MVRLFKHLFDGSTAPYINKKKDAAGNDFLISLAVHLQVRRSNPGISTTKPILVTILQKLIFTEEPNQMTTLL
nr:unnamed protein product [Callosobruchus chinensis]